MIRRAFEAYERTGKQISMASENVVLVDGGFVDGSGWEAVYGTVGLRPCRSRSGT